jgi:anthranilate/para-aminobenzoate synthase component II
LEDITVGLLILKTFLKNWKLPVETDGNDYGLKHKTYDVHGVQYHPESILTPDGETIIKNFLLN